LAVPGIGSAAPHDNRGLTINATPNPITAGDPVMIYGELNNPPVGGQTIILYHHLAGSGRGYTPVSRTTTDGTGFFQFPRADGVVMTNRSWFVREAGLHGVHSRTVYERVQALVSLAASTSTTDTNQPIVFTGHVTPNRGFERVLLQQQNGSGDDWHTLKAGFIGPGSNYAISYRWRIAGHHDVRVLFPGDRRNLESGSDPVTVAIQQAQVSEFTITSSAQEIDSGQPVTISGVDQSAAPGTQLALFERGPDQRRFTAVAFAQTGSGGSYSFASQTPAGNTLCQVRTTQKPRAHSAVLFESVRDLVQMTASSTTATVGGTVTFDGTVLPDKAGHVVYLQRQGADGDWHVVAVRFVSNASTFHFAWRFGHTGTDTFRARITSDERNIGAASAPLTITVTPGATSALPPAS
jgi:hypothetical protein